jgi:putative PIN family toxin of toxin-antitoxin system
MIRAVVDTNVLVSAIINPSGTPAQVLDAFYAGVFEPVVSDDILKEYTRVLTSKDLQLEQDMVTIMLHFFRHYCLPLPPTPVNYHCPDPDDVKFIAAALAGQAAFIITGNKRHFPSRIKNLTVISPREFLDFLTQ